MHVICDAPFESESLGKVGSGILACGEKGTLGKKVENHCSRGFKIHAFSMTIIYLVGANYHGTFTYFNITGKLL